MQLLVHKGRQTSVGRRSLATGNLIARTRLCAEEDSNPTGESPVGRVPRDPIEEEGGINLYGYVGNNPGVEIDPLGLESWGLTGPYDPRAFDPKFRGGVPPLPGFPSREEHLNRNKRNKCPKKQPKDNDLQLPCQHLGGGKWHQDKLLNIIEGKGGGQGNTFRGDDGSECVYDGAGNLLPDAGTYNFAGPGTWFNPGHYYQDVDPHFLYGVGSMPGQTTVYK